MMEKPKEGETGWEGGRDGRMEGWKEGRVEEEAGSNTGSNTTAITFRLVLIPSCKEEQCLPGDCQAGHCHTTAGGNCENQNSRSPALPTLCSEVLSFGEVSLD